jgi:hypothetical protein
MVFTMTCTCIEITKKKREKISSMATTTSKWQNRSKVMLELFAVREKENKTVSIKNLCTRKKKIVTEREKIVIDEV